MHRSGPRTRPARTATEAVIFNPRRSFNRWADDWRADWASDLDDPNNRRRAAFDMTWFDHGFLRAGYRNLAQVAPGIWRSNQPSPAQLADYAERGFQTILNLRGPSAWGSYHLEKRACAELGLNFVDLRLYSRAPPTIEAIHKLDHVFRTAPRPLLLHCKSGADRAGIGAALALLLTGAGDIDAALAQLHLRFGHIRAAKTGMLDHFLETYRDFNAATPTPFLTWVDMHFDRPAVEASFHARRGASFLVDRILGRE